MMSNRTTSKFLAMLMAVVFLGVQVLAVVKPPELPDPGSAPMSKQQQEQLGLQAAAEVYKQMPVLPDNSPETQYVRQIGQKLVAQIPAQYSWPYEFHTIPQKEINAFALPGGQMFINVGTITAAANEAQLAGVMAHEMSHVYMQHSAKQAGKASLTEGLAGLAGAILGAKGGILGSLAQAGIQFGATGLMLKYSRTDEAQADHVGAIIMYKAGYNPQELANFFKALETQGSPPQFLSDHPNPGNREAAIQQEIANWPAKSYTSDTGQFAKARQEAATVKLYTAQQISDGAKTGQWTSLNETNGAHPPAGVAATSGGNASTPSGSSASAPSGSSTPAPATVTPTSVSLKSVLPSSRMVSASVGPVIISHPDNWQVVQQQQGGGVWIAPQAGLNGSAMGYGAALNSAAAPSGQSMTLDQMTSAIVQNFEQGGDMKAAGSVQKIKAAGVQGRSVLLQSTSPFLGSNGQQQKENDWLVTVPQKDGSVVYLVFVAPQGDFQRFRPTFQKMLQSLRF